MAMESASGSARIRSGVYNKSGSQFIGKTVGQVRSEYGKMWGITTDTNAIKGTEKLSDDYVIQADDNIEFHRRSGEKG